MLSQVPNLLAVTVRKIKDNIGQIGSDCGKPID